MVVTKMFCACRLVPRSGEGRSGQEIDEYLMRLLRSGAANAADATMYRQEVHTHTALLLDTRLQQGCSAATRRQIQ